LGLNLLQVAAASFDLLLEGNWSNLKEAGCPMASGSKTATFRATLKLNGKTATGIDVPEKVIDSLGGGKRPPIVVTFAGHSYRTTVGVMAGRYLIPVSAEQRAAAGVTAGDELTVTVTLDEAPREVEVPEDLAAALKKAKLRADFDKLSPSNQKRHALSVIGAKTDETRQRRVDKVLKELGA
jgi:Bacteriocin-protection, YdeI or OmpD-Associated/Domain of unknown function (DUF1905)